MVGSKLRTKILQLQFRQIKSSPIMCYVSVAWVTHPSTPGLLIESAMKPFISDALTTGGDYYLPTIIKGTGFIALPYFLIDLNYTSVSAAVA